MCIMLYFSHFFAQKSTKIGGFKGKPLVDLRKTLVKYKDAGEIIPLHL